MEPMLEGDGPGGPLPAPSQVTGFRSARFAQFVLSGGLLSPAYLTQLSQVSARRRCLLSDRLIRGWTGLSSSFPQRRRSGFVRVLL